MLFGNLERNMVFEYNDGVRLKYFVIIGRSGDEAELYHFYPYKNLKMEQFSVSEGEWNKDGNVYKKSELRTGEEKSEIGKYLLSKVLSGGVEREWM